ncbi:MAG: DNA alkylation repair protein [Desulfobacterales bacterium]|jgi:3-methyladenine DNA glycosylase AlkD|nr:DNA alkylation repair protein [Desulfobacterales bacterium]
MQLKAVLAELKSMGDPEATAGMARYGINADRALGISIPRLQGLAKNIGKNHKLAGELWSCGIHEARILACMIDDPQQVTEAQLERWVKEFDSWDLCDQCCNRLIRKTEFAHQKALAWARRPEEFVKRAGFVLMAVLAVHDKKAADRQFDAFFRLIKKEAVDARNFVKKAVNWALRQIGKRNTVLNQKAIAVAEDIQRIDSKAARWVAQDALRELTGEKIQKRLSYNTYHRGQDDDR